MQTPEFWISFVGQALLRGTGWLLLIALAAHLTRRASASRRALLRQMGFAGLLLLPLVLRALPPVPVFHASPTPAATNVPSPPADAPQEDSRIHPYSKMPASPTTKPTGTLLLPASVLPAVSASPAAKRAMSALPLTQSPLNVRTVLFLGWAVGAAALLLRLGCGMLALRRLARNSACAPGGLISELNAAREQIAPGRTVALRVATPGSGLHAPVTWGLFRPVVMLPARCADQSADRARAALLHELAHVARADWAWLLCAQVVCALYWCVPFVWIAARRLRAETEMACDDSVLTAGIPAPDYADQILEVARIMTTHSAHPPLSALTMARPPLTEARIRAILAPHRRREPATRRLRILAALIPAVCVPLLSLRAIAAYTRPIGVPVSPEIAAGAVPIDSPLDAVSPASPVSRHTAAIPSAPAWPLRFARPGVGAPSSARSAADAGALPLHAALPASPAAGARLSFASTASAALPATEPQPSGILWGPVVDGLQAGLRMESDKRSFAPGAPIWQETYLRNRSHAEVIVTTIGGYEEQGAPVVTNARGGRVKVLQYFGMGMMFVASCHVRPGEMALVGRVTLAFLERGTTGDSFHEVAPSLSFSAQGMPIALAPRGAYTLRQDLSPFAADGKTPLKRLSTGSVRIEIAGKLTPIVPVDPNQIMDIATAPVAWGPVRSGLQAGLITLQRKSRYYTGERVRAAVILRNVSQASISFWHQASFAFLEPPILVDSAGKKWPVTPSPELEWAPMNGLRILGVTYDHTYAPSADGPSRLAHSEIKPGQFVLGYYLTALVVPPALGEGHPAIGRFRLVQPCRFGLGPAETLDTTLETGGLELELSDPDRIVQTKN